jgi:hypothetical protein
MEDAVQHRTGRESGRVQDQEKPLSSNTQQGTGQVDQYSTGPPSSGHKVVSVYEAADALGITVDAIRKRIQRGTIAHQRGEDGRVWVSLDVASNLRDPVNSTVADAGEHAYRSETRDELVDSLQDQVEYLRQVIETRDLELQRKDSIIAALTQRIPPELEPLREPPQEPPTPSETPSDGSAAGKGDVPLDEEGTQDLRPWYRRFFGL